MYFSYINLIVSKFWDGSAVKRTRLFHDRAYSNKSRNVTVL